MEIKVIGNNTTHDKFALNGEFVVIDPCYVFRDDLWAKLIDCWEFGKTNDDGHDFVIVNIDGHDVVMFSTAYGDGGYPVRDIDDNCVIGEADVDSGCLAFVPIELVKTKVDGINVIVDGNFVMEERGVVQCDHILVDTKRGHIEEEEEDDWDEDDDDDLEDDEGEWHI